MSLLIQYDFSSSSFRAPDTIKNIASGNTSYLYNATMVNNPQINSIGVTKQSSSVLFNVSKQQYIKIPALSIGNTGLTFTFWFKSNNNDTWARIFDFGNGPGNNNIIAFINNGYLGFAVYLGGNVGYHPSNVIPNVNNNTWTHIAWTLTYPNGWNIYVNGTLYTTFSDGSYPNSVFKNLNYIGKSNWNDPYFNGNIAEFRMYNSVLSANDISLIYTNDKSLLSKTSGNAVLNTGFNELYNQIFCDLFKTNSGFNQCQDCNYGQQQEVFSTTTEVGEQNCLTACQNEPHCTSYSYDTTAATNNCKQYSTFPSEILNGVNGTNSGYSLEKYTYEYDRLSNSQKSNSQEKCIAQYLNNYFTPQNQIDVSKCLTTTTSGNNTNINADAACIYNTYLTNGLNPTIINYSKYNENSDYNLTYQSDPVIDNYKASYSKYSNDLVKISNINNKLSYTSDQNDIDYNNIISNDNANLYNKFDNSIKQKEKEMTTVLDNALDGLIEKFENKINNTKYINSGKLLLLIIIILLIFFAIYTFKKK
jgi:hypothetical protein